MTALACALFSPLYCKAVETEIRIYLQIMQNVECLMAATSRLFAEFDLSDQIHSAILRRLGRLAEITERVRSGFSYACDIRI